LFYWFDLILNAVAAALFSVRWFVFTDHSLPENADDGITEEQHEQLFKMESSVSIAILIILWLVHVGLIFYIKIALAAKLTSHFRSILDLFSPLTTLT
jgi:hypothetical protein